MVLFALFFGLAIAAFVCLLFAAWRFTMVRPRGVAACMKLDGRGHRWHHGVLVFGENEVSFFRLRSIRPCADVKISRYCAGITDRSQLSAVEKKYVGDCHVLTVTDHDRMYSIAADSGLDTALVSWLESAPSERTQRMSSYPRPVASEKLASFGTSAFRRK